VELLKKQYYEQSSPQLPPPSRGLRERPSLGSIITFKVLSALEFGILLRFHS